MEKKKINVYLQYPWKFPDSPYYKYLIENPPEGIKFLNAEKQKGVIINKKKFFLSNFIKKSIRGVFHTLGIPILNTHLTKTGENVDLIHCAHCMSLNESPWVADFESWWQFWISGALQKRKLNKVKKLILNENCKKIIPWTDAIKKDILEVMPEIKNKIEVVCPAVPFPNFKKIKHKKVTILYVARYFWVKGGLIALETLKKLKKKHDIEIIFISDVPKKIKEKYPDIKILDLVPQKKLIEYYKSADIFFYPSLLDTFGFSLLESMSFGIPIVALNTGGTTNCKEIIEDGKTGLIIDVPSYQGNKIYKKIKRIGKVEEEVIEQLVEKTGLLIKNKKLREKMSKECRETIKSGKFSIQARNKKLKKIYLEALK
ncbi:MAG TPA: glycosyltransferase family 4 protein [Candidatus Pacearchaeota archaeon]|nr:glycosyltransferase family 4 protein [Candidatus Pacearchaeota archaeon]